MRTFEEFVQQQKEGLFDFLRKQDVPQDPNIANDRLNKMVAHQKAMHGQNKFNQQQQTNRAQQPTQPMQPTQPTVPNMNDEQIVSNAWQANSSKDNPFPKGHPNHQKWFNAFMDANMQN